MAKPGRSARDGGTIALVKDGYMVTIDARGKTLTVDVAPAELARRKAAWKPRPTAYPTGALAKYEAVMKEFPGTGAAKDAEVSIRNLTDK